MEQAFVQADVDEGIYEEFTRRESGHFWGSLHRTTYGLVQASRCFDHDKQSDDLEDAGGLSRQRQARVCVFRKIVADEAESGTYRWCTSTTLQYQPKGLRNYGPARAWPFSIKDLGEASYYLSLPHYAQ